MSTQMQIKPSEHGVVRLFAIDLPMSEAQAFDVDALAAALGGVTLDGEHVDLFNIDDLDELGLDGYLIHGIGVKKPEVVQLRPQIRALKGQVALIRSAAFGGKPATLTPKKPLRWIASFGEVPLDLTSKPLHSESAKGTISGHSAPVPTPTAGAAKWMYYVFILIAVIIFTFFAR